MNKQQLIDLIKEKGCLTEAKKSLLCYNRAYVEQHLTTGALSVGNSITLSSKYTTKLIGELVPSDLMNEQEWLELFCEENPDHTHLVSSYKPNCYK